MSTIGSGPRWSEWAGRRVGAAVNQATLERPATLPRLERHRWKSGPRSATVVNL
jgi:hypothetical protein